MMVAVRLPDHLCISDDPIVPVVHQRREPQRRLCSSIVIAIPVDGIAKVAFDEAEEAELVMLGPVGGGDEVIPPPLLIIVLWVRPLADADVTDSEHRRGEHAGVRSATDWRLRFQPESQAAPHDSVVPSGGCAPRELGS